MIGLTRRQADALRFIAGYMEARGCAPGLKEAASALGLKSKTGIHRIARALEERGYIRKLPNRARAIEVLHPISIPRSPEGEPLFFVRIGEA